MLNYNQKSVIISHNYATFITKKNLEEIVEKITKNANACLENLLSDTDDLEAHAKPSKKTKRTAGKKRKTEPEVQQLAKRFIMDEADGINKTAKNNKFY